MAVDWTILYQNLASQVGEITPDPKSPSGYHITSQREWNANPPDSKKVLWWKSYAKPIFNLWSKFKSEQLSDNTSTSAYIAFAERFQTNWDIYEDWKKKLDALRAEAKLQNFVITAPATTELPTTVWNEAVKDAEKVVKDAGDAWSFVKYAAWAALGLGAIVALSSVAQNLRAGRDPVEAFRRRGRAAARAVMPLPARLALSSGDSSGERV
jgi:hypothetical protein